MFITDEPKLKKFVRITNDDPQWNQSDGLAIYPRAGFDIMPECPSHHILLLQEALRKGWIRQSVYVSEKTLMWETLQK